MPSDRDDAAADTRDPALVRAQAELAQTRAQVALSITRLQREVARAVDWREWIRRKPALAVGLALGLGLMLGYSHSKTDTRGET